MALSTKTKRLVNSIVRELCPSVESAASILRFGELEDNPRTVLESAIALLFVVQRAIVAATENGELRLALMESSKQTFLKEFEDLARSETLNEDEFIDLVRERLVEYDRVLRGKGREVLFRFSMSTWQHICGDSDNRDAHGLILGGLIFSRGTAAAKFLKAVLH